MSVRSIQLTDRKELVKIRATFSTAEFLWSVVPLWVHVYAPPTQGA